MSGEWVAALVVVAAVSGFLFARQNITVKIQAARRQTVDALLAYYGRHGVTMAQHHDLPAGQGNVCFPRDDETREVYWRCTACNVRGRPTLDAQQTVADGWSHFLRKHPAATR